MKKLLIVLGIVFLVIIILFVTVVMYCSFSSNKLMPSIDKFITDFHSEYNKQNFSYIYNTMTDVRFRKVDSYTSFEKLMNSVYQKLGAVKEQKRGYAQISYTKGETYVNIQYTTTHQNGDARETFVLKQNKESWLLVSYNVGSKKLLL